MYKIFKILFASSKQSFIFIAMIIFLSLFSFVFTGSLISSVEKYVENSSKDFLGADIILSGRDTFFENKEKYLKDKYNVETSKKVSFNTSIFFDGIHDLYTINYIEKNYPFYGNFESKEVNRDGVLIVSEKVYQKFGDNEIEILGNKYKIKGYLEKDFLSDINPFGGNDIYISYDKISFKNIEKLSRIKFDLLIKTDEKEKISKDKNLSELRINSQERSNNTLNQITDRLNLFIQIFYQIIILLTFFVIIVNFESYFRKIIKNIKTLNILGLENYKIILSFFVIFIIISIISSLLSFALVHVIFEYGLNSIGGLKADINLFYKSIIISFLIILSGSFLNLIKLKATKINNLSDNDFNEKFKYYIKFYFIFLFFILTTIAYFSGVKLIPSIIISFGFIVIIVIIILFLKILLKIIFNTSKFFLKRNFYIYDAIRSTIKPGNLSIIIVFSSFISITGFLIFSTFANGFIGFLNNNIDGRIDTFVLNLNQEDIEKIKNEFNENEYFEIIRSRILKINGKSLKEHLGTQEVSGRFSREFSAITKVFEEYIVKGNKLESNQVGIDKDFAKALGVEIGDIIEFSILGKRKELKISQLRKSANDTDTPFFYFNFYKQDFEKFSKNYFLSYNSKEKRENFNLELNEKLGNQATFINIGDFINRIKNISEYILYFVQVILSYIGIFSIMTFIVSINFLRGFKKQKIENYNKFGASKSKIKKSVFYEYLYLVLLGLTISIIISLTISGIIFYSNDFIEFEYRYFYDATIVSIIFLIIYIAIYKILENI